MFAIIITENFRDNSVFNGLQILFTLKLFSNIILASS